LLGITVRELISSSDLQAKGMKAVADRVSAAASLSMMDLSVEAEAFGSKIAVSDDEVPTVIGRIIESPEDADALKIPDVHAGRTGKYVRAIEKAVSLIKGRPVFGGVIGPFSLSGRLMDMTEIMVNCYVEPDMVHTTLSQAAEFNTKYVLEYKKVGAHGIVMAEPAAGLLSPEMADEFSSKYIKKIAAAVSDDSFMFIYHNCGNTIPLIDSILGIGADAYHFGNAVNMAEMLKLVPSDVLVFGNIDPSGQFRNGTPESVYNATLGLLKAAAKHKNFVISSGCDIPPPTSWANIEAFFTAISDFYN